MTRMLRAVACAALGLALAAGPVRAASSDPAWRPYEDAASGFTIEFPRGWAIAKDPFQILVATAPRESSADGFLETIKIVATDVAPGVTLDAYYRNSLEVYKSIWKVHGASTGEIAGIRARRVVIDQTIGSRRTRLLKCFMLAGGRIFVITCVSEPASFDAQLPVFEAALATFRVAPRSTYVPRY